jgi:hypothetical protein
MLPRLLCEQLCSLNPGEERFAFSIIWELDEDGNVLEEWAGRCVGRGCGFFLQNLLETRVVLLHPWEEGERGSL